MGRRAGRVVRGRRRCSRRAAPARCRAPVAPPPIARRGSGERDARLRASGCSRGSSPRPRLARRADDARDARPIPGWQKDGRDLELPPWNKGRYGTAIGRAVHAVLQTVDLATGRRARRRPPPRRPRPKACSVEEATIAALVRAALASDTVRSRERAAALAGDLRRGAGRGHDARGLRRPRATAPSTASSSSTTRPTRSATTADLARRLDHYRIQGAAYALAVGEAVGRAGRRVRVRVPRSGRRARGHDRGRRPRGRAIAQVRALVAERARGPVAAGPGGARRTLNRTGTAVPSLCNS